MSVQSHLDALLRFVEKENYMGYDPYDALNSPAFHILSLKSKYIRIAFIQFMKKSPINIRPIMGIKKDYNPKGLGLFLWSYAKLYKIDHKQEYLEKIDFFLNKLEKLKSTGYSGNCWGYSFDWQSRAFFLPRYTPTLVNSSFIGHALLDTYSNTGRPDALKMALSIKDFILNDLNRREEDSAVCFSYSPLDRSFVHNANLLGCSFLIRLNRFIRESELCDIALAGLKYTAKYQRPEGSWFYAETPFQKWIDSFHTGFNLQSILYFLLEGRGEEYRDTFNKGIEFYAKELFLINGTPKYYHNSAYPFDIHAAAQAVVLFSLVGNKFMVQARTILSWMIHHLKDQKGFFYYQKGRYILNKIPYMRWSQSWALHAFTSYISANE